MSDSNSALNHILDSDFLQSLAKSADLYKIGSNSILDPEEIIIGLKVVPRAVMSMLISELTPMEINTTKDIRLPFGKNAYLHANKNAADDYTGSVYNNNKLVYDFMNRSIPGLGIILLSTFELYDLEELKKPQVEMAPTEDIDRKVQKLIDERMELHSLVGRVVENKMAEREAVHKMMMAKLSDALRSEAKKNSQIAEIKEISQTSAPMSDPYFRGMANGLVVADAIANDKHDPKFVEHPIKPINIEAKDIHKKEAPIRKGSPLKEFLDKKKKPLEKSYHVEMSKSETMDCGDCGQEIFGKGQIAACLCYGENMDSKLWIKKSEDGIQIRFSKNWSIENIEMLLETLRAKK